MNEQINGYALALYEIAHEQKAAKKFKNIAIMLRSLMDKNHNLITVLNAYELTQKQKLALIAKVFNKSLPRDWMNFCTILAYRRKFTLILPILNKLIKLLNNYLKIKEGIVYSTILLNKQELNSVVKKINQLINGPIELVNKLDASLIGGIKVVIDSEEFDYSLSSRLRALKNEMLDESERR